jgi:hypothetical protein
MMWGWGQGDVPMLWGSGGQGGREIFVGGGGRFGVWGNEWGDWYHWKYLEKLIMI